MWVIATTPQITLQAVFFNFPSSSLPSGTSQTPGHLIYWCSLSTPSFVRHVFSLHYTLQEGFDQSWCIRNMSIPLQFVSFYNSQKIVMLCNCMLDPDADLPLGNMVFAFDVHYHFHCLYSCEELYWECPWFKNKQDMSKEHIVQLSEIHLTNQTCFKRLHAAVISGVGENSLALEPSAAMTETRHFTSLTQVHSIWSLCDVW